MGFTPVKREARSSCKIMLPVENNILTVKTQAAFPAKNANFLENKTMKVEKKTKIRNRYNQVPYLNQKPIGELTKTQENTIHKRAKRSALSWQVTTRLQGTYKDSIIKIKMKHI